MPMTVGTNDITTLLAARFTSSADFGMNNIAAILAADTDAYNASWMEAVAQLADISTDRQRIYGSSTGGQMVKVDEYGRSATQKAQPGSTVAFPMDRFQYGVGFTRRFEERATPADYAIAQQGAQRAHYVALRQEMQRAIYTATNATVTDHLVDNVTLTVRRFVNADSQNIPNGPNGDSFTASTHTHYNANATLTASALAANITDVIEHGHGGRVITAVNHVDVASFTALTGFVPAPQVGTIAATSAAQTIEQTNATNQFNRFLGIFNGSEIWVKPWAIANYAFTWDAAADIKPLVIRQDTAGQRGLHIAADLELYPLRADYYESDFGIGVWGRTNGAVLMFSNGTYSSPTIS